jgi:hypothetical protein
MEIKNETEGRWKTNKKGKQKEIIWERNKEW